jgi:phosphate-selective porin OprO/OprP
VRLSSAGEAKRESGDTPSEDEADPVLEETAAEKEVREESLTHEIEEWAPETKPAQRRRLIHPDRWRLEWRHGLRLRGEDGRYEMMAGARFLGDAGLAHLGGGLERARESGWASGYETRQARLYIQGVAFQHFVFKTGFELSDGELRDVYVGIREIGPFNKILLGYQKEPFSLEQQTSFRAIPFMERSLANALTPHRNSGILASGNLFDWRLRWAAGAFVIVDSFREEDDSSRGFNDDWDLTFRITGLPVYREEGAQLLLTGVSYSHQFVDDEGVSFASRPESSLVGPLIETPPIAGVDHVERVGVEMAWVDGSLTVQGEGIVALLERGGGRDDLAFRGGYVQASWFPTGERRVYGRRSGVFGRIVPSSPFTLRGPGWGAIELAARFSYLDLEDGSARGGRQFDTTLGVNWYLNAQVRLMLNWVRAHVAGEGNANMLQTRLQLDF